VNEGSFNCVIGPNGAGKTTLLKLLTGELALESGDVLVDNKSINEYSTLALANRRAVVSQFHDTGFSFRCDEIIDMAFDALSPDQISLASDHKACAAQIMEIDDLLPRRFDRLSGGEQQRVVCARALTQLGVANESLNDKLLLLDEPTSNMDIRHQLAFFNALKWL
jgi:iron complex transport system ATP-binding protein